MAKSTPVMEQPQGLAPGASVPAKDQRDRRDESDPHTPRREDPPLTTRHLGNRCPIAHRICAGAATTGKDGTIYAIGSVVSNGNYSSEVEAYNPSTNQWTSVAPLPTDRGSLAATTGKDGTIYAIGGVVNNGNYSSEVEAYNPSTNQWTSVAPLPTARAFLAATTGKNGTIYAFGGDDGSVVGSSEVDAITKHQPMDHHYEPPRRP